MPKKHLFCLITFLFAGSWFLDAKSRQTQKSQKNAKTNETKQNDTLTAFCLPFRIHVQEPTSLTHIRNVILNNIKNNLTCCRLCSWTLTLSFQSGLIVALSAVQVVYTYWVSDERSRVAASVLKETFDNLVPLLAAYFWSLFLLFKKVTLLRDGPLDKLWGGWGILKRAWIFFRKNFSQLV